MNAIVAAIAHNLHPVKYQNSKIAVPPLDEEIELNKDDKKPKVKIFESNNPETVQKSPEKNENFDSKIFEERLFWIVVHLM